MLGGHGRVLIPLETTLGDKSQIQSRDPANAVVVAAAEDPSPDISFVLSDLSLIQRRSDLPKQNKNPEAVVN